MHSVTRERENHSLSYEIGSCVPRIELRLAVFFDPFLWDFAASVIPVIQAIVWRQTGLGLAVIASALLHANAEAIASREHVPIAQARIPASAAVDWREHECITVTNTFTANH